MEIHRLQRHEGRDKCQVKLLVSHYGTVAVEVIGPRIFEELPNKASDIVAHAKVSNKFQVVLKSAYKFWHHEQEEKIFCQLRAVKSSASSEKATSDKSK